MHRIDGVTCRGPRACRAARGISLIEVLISIFILSVGLMGVAALIPVGRFEVVQAAKMDRAAVAGRAAFREVKIRGLLRPDLWYVPDPSKFDPSRPFVIDPLGVGWSLPPCPAMPNGGPQMPRLSLLGPGKPPCIIPAAADRIFTCRDDLYFELPDDPEALPTWRSSAGGIRSIEGNYSWMLTVTPVVDTRLPQPVIVDGLHTVAVAVFYKRNRSPQGERMLNVMFPNGNDGWGGGDVEVTLPSEPPADPPELKSNQWLMLVARDPAATNPLASIRYLKWYRIAAVEDAQGATGAKRRVTLVGPDWPKRQFAAMNATTYAVWFDEVVGVYEKTIQVDGPSLWSN
ncbi:MAG: type IV pilus modification PilV family protein [Pirellulales bacterium]